VNMVYRITYNVYR